MTHGRKPKLPVVPALADEGRAPDDAAALRPVRARPGVAVPVIRGSMQPTCTGGLGSFGEARSVDAQAAAVTIPKLKTVSALNARETWRQRDRRVRGERTMAKIYMQKVRRPIDAAHITIHLVRIGPGKLDSDNLQGAMKAVRDGVADWLGIDDGSDRLTWTYAQERSGGPGLYAVRIEVTPC